MCNVVYFKGKWSKNLLKFNVQKYKDKRFLRHAINYAVFF